MMPQLHFTIHSGAAAGSTWRTAGKSSVHLHHGELEAADAYYVACMAVIVLGIANRSVIRTLRLVPEGKLEDFAARPCTSTRDRHSAGPKDLLETVDHLVRTELFSGSRASTVRFVLDCLAGGGVCILELRSSFRDRQHVLAIGLESRADDSRRSISALLLLDSGHGCAKYVPWNGRLSIRAPFPDRRRLHYLDGSGQLSTAWIQSAIGLYRRIP